MRPQVDYGVLKLVLKLALNLMVIVSAMLKVSFREHQLRGRILKGVNLRQGYAESLLRWIVSSLRLHLRHARLLSVFK